jgi:hypothetical protein
MAENYLFLTGDSLDVFSEAKNIKSGGGGINAERHGIKKQSSLSRDNGDRY